MSVASAASASALPHTLRAGRERSAECDTACVVSLCNLGDIASLSGNTEEARRRFQDARDMSKKVDFGEGLKQAEAGLRRLSAKNKA